MYRERGGSGSGMEFRYRAVDEQSAPHPPPHPPSSYTYFTQQALRAGYMGPGLGRMQENFQNPVLNREEIERELAKERIREEIIAAETRRRMLEAEVRRQMMLEKELAYSGRGNGFDTFSVLPGAGMRFHPTDLSFRPVGGQSIEDRIAISLEEKLRNASRHGIGGHEIVPFQERMLEPEIAGMRFHPTDLSFRPVGGQSIEDRIAISLEEKLRNASRHGIGGHEIVPFQERMLEPEIAGHEMIPFQQRAMVPKIAEVSYSEVTKENEKEKIVFLANPETNLSGQKRKSATPPEEDTSELPLIGFTKKKVKEEWSCAVCQVSATSEHGLNEHLQGRKHKSKEAALITKRSGKNFGIGVGTQNAAKPKKLKEITTNHSCSKQGGKLMVQLLPSNQTGKSSLQIIRIDKSPKENDLPVLEIIPKKDITKNEVLGTDAKKKKKKKKFQFWCAMCRVGARSENVMEAHRNGKKHKTALEEAVKNKVVATPRVGGTEINGADEPTETLVMKRLKCNVEGAMA